MEKRVCRLEKRVCRLEKRDYAAGNAFMKGKMANALTRFLVQGGAFPPQQQWALAHFYWTIDLESLGKLSNKRD
jgi:hypothetical protein